jgi:hypothetical protein
MINQSLGLNDLPYLRSKPRSSLTSAEREYVDRHRNIDVDGLSDRPTRIIEQEKQLRKEAEERAAAQRAAAEAERVRLALKEQERVRQEQLALPICDDLTMWQRVTRTACRDEALPEIDPHEAIPTNDAERYLRWDPDMWPEEMKVKLQLLWRNKYKDSTYMDMYALLLNDEGYWYNVNGVIANLPPEPGKVHTSVDDQFYTITLPWACVQVDWNEDIRIERNRKLKWRRNHQRPSGMGLELTARNIKFKAGRAAGTIVDAGSKILETHSRVLDAGASLLEYLAGLFNSKDSPFLASLSFTSVLAVGGGIAIAALYFK